MAARNPRQGNCRIPISIILDMHNYEFLAPFLTKPILPRRRCPSVHWRSWRDGGNLESECELPGSQGEGKADEMSASETRLRNACTALAHICRLGPITAIILAGLVTM